MKGGDTSHPNLLDPPCMCCAINQLLMFAHYCVHEAPCSTSIVSSAVQGWVYIAVWYWELYSERSASGHDCISKAMQQYWLCSWKISCLKLQTYPYLVFRFRFLFGFMFVYIYITTGARSVCANGWRKNCKLQPVTTTMCESGVLALVDRRITPQV